MFRRDLDTSTISGGVKTMAGSVTNADTKPTGDYSASRLRATRAWL